MIESIRKSIFTKAVAAYLSLSMLTEFIWPRAVFALTGGPSQPEVQSFSPIGTSEMVDPFTGDFTYNIPLMDVGGYPINLVYNSGIGMDQEASWVGLGWNINAGVINREMRGIPDDFKDDYITKEFNIKPNRTYRVSGGFGAEAFGIKGTDLSGNLSFGIGISYNNYTGFGMEQMSTVGIGLSAGEDGKLNGSLGITSNSDEGLTVNPNISYSHRIAEANTKDAPGTAGINGGLGVGTSFNSKSGLKGLTMNLSVSGATKYDSKPPQERSGSIGVSSSTISFGAQTYTPQMTMPLKNSAVTVSVKIGGTFFGIDGSYDVGAAFSEQRLDSKRETAPGYGYLYSNYGQNNGQALLDFNREKDGSFTLNTPHLPLTNFTYDIYSISGQGVGGSFRPFRGDMGYVFDSRSTVTSDSYSLGAEIDAGNAAHGGGDVAVTEVTGQSGKWKEDNNAIEALGFTATQANDLKEPVYFRQVGEKSVDGEPAFLNNMGGTLPVRIALEDAGGLVVRATDKLLSEYNSEPGTLTPTNARSERVKRNQVFSYLTKAQAMNHGLEKTLYSSLTEAQPHHIAEVTVLRPDGTRYIYGLPLYNTKQKEVSFNSSGRSASCATGIVNYQSGDNSTGNSRGLDNYYNSVETPGYAHSYLLTAIISPDYVDMDGNGPSDNDLGTYTKFIYSPVSIHYRWRVPYGDKSNMQANFSEGLKTDPQDDKGSYVYGEKKIKYLERIETKNYVAKFDIADRADALGVIGEDGVFNLTSCDNVSHMKLLKKISLYSKPDYIANLGDLTNATPIKEVHFEYDYSLCPSVHNNERFFNINNGTCSYWDGDSAFDDSGFPNQGGKLTLKKIYFTYGKSLKGKFSPYQFEYNGLNPSYNIKGYDRWGNYKPNSGGCGLTDNLPNAEFPYTDQGTITDDYASAWSLTNIILPSGGSINIDYESDDYAYVQDKRAMQMFKIAGVEQTPDAIPSGHTISSAPVQNLMNGITTGNDHIFLYFQLQQPYASADVDRLEKEYFNDQPTSMQLYFRFLVNLTKSGNLCSYIPGGSSGQDYEYISGYADISSVGLMGTSAPYTHGYIELDPVNIGDKEITQDVHPICKAAWQFGRIYRSALLNCQAPISESGGIKNAVMSIINSNFYKNLAETVAGANNVLNVKGFGKQARLDKSWVRLFNPIKKKKGGGVRVKQITISDEWDNMVSGASAFQYGQEYEYTMTEGTNTISSGVAQYEPILGGDENPWKQPIPFGNDAKEKLLIPDDEHYMEGPLGESFFPAPTVGYRQVTVKNLHHDNVKRTATGKVVHEFYTAYDFPVITRSTTPKVIPKKKNPLLELFTFKGKDYLTASEGFSIELNDMHGKPKGQKVFAEDKDEPISSVEYRYKQSGFQRLDNAVTIINKNGSTSSENVGLEVDFIADFREQQTKIVTEGLNGNLASFLAAIIPGFVPTVLPSYQSEETRFRSAVVTKVIRRYGIMNEIIATDAGSMVSTENLAWDAETGEVLVTKTINGFNDPVYSLTYPAHWAYKGMGPAYKNVGADITLSFSGGVATSVTDALNRFSEGDELSIGTSRAWVVEVTSNTVKAVMENGDAASGTASKVLRSGRRNMQNTPVGTITLRSNPLTVLQSGSFEDVLNASAVEFSDQWGMFEGYTEVTPAQCICEETNQAADLLPFFNALTANNGLLACDLPLFNSGSGYAYPEYNNSSLDNTTLDEDYYTAEIPFQRTLDMYPGLGDLVYAIRKTSDGGYVMVGDVNNEIPVLTKTDCNGKELWAKAYAGSGEPVLRSVTEAKDASGTPIGYVMAGTTDNRIILTATDLDGNELTTRYITVNLAVTGGFDHARGFHIIQTEDGAGMPDGFVISGSVMTAGSDIYSTLLVKISNTGSLVWNKLFQDAGEGFTVKNVDDDSDGDAYKDDGFIIAGTRNVSGSVSSFLLRTANDGSFMWEKTYGGTGFFIQSNFEDTEPFVDEVVQQTSDGGFIFTGVKSIDDDIPYTLTPGEPVLIKTNSSGNVLWAKSYDVGEYGIGTSVKELPEGGYVITGPMVNNPSSAFHNAFLLKTNSTGGFTWIREFNNSFGISLALSGTGKFLFAGGEGAAVPWASTNFNQANAYYAKTDDNGQTGCENTFSVPETTLTVTPTTPTVAEAVHFIDYTAQAFTSPNAQNTITDNCCKSASLIMEIEQTSLPACSISLAFPAGTELCMNNITGFSNLQVVPTTSCDVNTGNFTVDASISVPDEEPITITMSGSTTCWNVGGDCVENPESTFKCGFIEGDVVNPYFQGMKGNWRAKKSWLYLTGRSQTLASNNTNVRTDGVFSSFSPFWMPNGLVNDWIKDITDWTFTSEVTQFSPFGFEVENRDALGRSSAALYGYNNSLPVAVASNSAYRHIAFDSFEDYDFINPNNCMKQHFNYYSSGMQRSQVESHTGLYSLRVPPGGTASVKRDLSADPCLNAGSYTANEYHLGDCDFIGLFSPQESALSDEIYVLSVWTKAQFPGQTTYTGMVPQVKVGGALVPQTLIKGAMVDRWQRIEVEFTVPAGSTGEIEVELKNNYNNSNAYFDDIRIHPVRSNMKSFVYHPVNLRLMAELDENNYATMYEYDEEGGLIRVKKETERGIQTIQESRNNSFKINVP